MIKKDRPKISTQFEINAIVFYANMVLFLPLVLVITYLFEIDKHLNINDFMFWTLIANFVILITGTIILAINRDRLRRKVKVTYKDEYFYLIFLFVFGLLGFVVIYDNMGGNRAYIANILIVLFAGLLYLAIFLGRRYFNLDYIKNR
jgi:nitrate reductase gamma subunit